MAAITTGYNDWADLPSFDADLDVSETNVTHPSGSMSGAVLNVQNWASVGVAITPVSGAIIGYLAQWTSDQAGAILVATREWSVDPASASSSCGFLPNLGPYVSITTFTATGSFTHSYYQWRSQRLVTPSWVPQAAFLFNQGNVTLAAGNTSTQFGQYIYGGPVQVRWGTAGQPGTLAISSVNFNLGYTNTTDTIILPANSTGRLQLVLPEATHRLQITNTGAGSAAFSANVWPSITGSS